MDFSRHLLEKHFGDDPRLIAEFEALAQSATENASSATTAVDATNAIKDAAVVVLSGNSEFTNERVLKVSDDIDIQVTATEVRLTVKNVARTQDFSVLMVPSNDTEVGLPPEGTLVSEKAVPALVNAANDAAAAGAGVPIGGMYRNGSVLMVRVV